MPATSQSISLGFLKPRVDSKTHKKVSDDDILAFFQQLSTLFRAGTPIYEALIISSDQCQSDDLSAVIEQVGRKVAAGEAMYEAMAAHPGHFKTEWVEVIKSGEASGKLGKILEQLVAQVDASAKMRRKMVSAMMYPSVIFSVAVIAITVMLVKVVPTFAEMFNSFGKELPGITVAVLAVSDFLQARGLLIVGVVVVVVVSVRRWIRTPDGRRAFHITIMSLPVIGEVVIQAAMQKFAINVALLLRAGLPLLETIQSLQGIFHGNWVYEQSMTKVRKHVERGGTMADGLEQTGVFTSFLVSMTRIGEESGTLPEVLDETEAFYRTKVETLIGRVTGLMETVVILFMGVAVAVILTSIYLPMFSMAGGVG
jgi:type IV pilus assembly protein PilC